MIPTHMSDQSDAEQFAAFINALLDSQNLSGAQAARRLKVAQSQVSRWRRGEGGISLENLHRIHEVFGTDLNYLKRLAGLPASSPSTVQEDEFPELDAMIDAERVEIHEELRDIPQLFWTAILTAQRAARRQAIATALAALELVSTPGNGELAPPVRRRRRDDRSDSRDGKGPLAVNFSPAGSY